MIDFLKNLGSELNIPGTSFQITSSFDLTTLAIRAAVKSDPSLPKVVVKFSDVQPIKPWVIKIELLSIFLLFKKFILIRLYTDSGPKAREYQQLEVERFGTAALPYYVVLSSNNQEMLDNNESNQIAEKETDENEQENKESKESRENLLQFGENLDIPTFLRNRKI